MELDSGEDNSTLLTLTPSLSHPAVVTLQDDSQPLLLCPVDAETTLANDTITYLSPAEEFVLDSTSSPLLKDPREGQLVVLGEAGEGEPITYIYIKGEGATSDTSKDDGQTITLNSADGTTLETLPGPYASQYGDLVLVGPSETPPSLDIAGEGEGDKEQVLLLSVRPLKVEDETPAETLTPVTSEQLERSGEVKKETNHAKVTRERRSDPQKRRKARKTDAVIEEDEESTTYEARLATRDSMLPPRRVRRIASAGNFTCPSCDAKFRHNEEYHEHLKLHTGTQAWHCPICSHPCDTPSALQKHRATSHASLRPYPCPNCPLAFPKSLILEDHIRSVHNKERPYPCSLCSKAFYRPYDLKMHLNLHLGIKTKTCDVCGRQFSHSSNLIRHQCLHTGAKPYVCNTCGKRFKQVTLLHKHHMMHQEGSCPLCPNAVPTATPTALRRHYKLEHKRTITLKEAARVMRGQKGPATRSFYCRVCGEMFTVKAELKAHEEEKHPGDSHHPCASCTRVFPVSEIKNHACLSPDETKTGVNLKPKTSTTPTGLILQDGVSEDDLEEEYLVMYITPEGESVSYVMKRGTRLWQDEVLQVNASQEVEGIQEGAEDTILINVNNQDALLPSESFNTPDITQDMTPELPLHAIKIEPQGNDEALSTLDPDPTLRSLKTEPATEIKAEEKTEVPAPKRKKGTGKAHLVCGDCGKTFNKQWNFQQHLATHDASLHRYKCEQCGMTFAYRSTYNKHIDNHNPTPQMHKCQLCPKIYKCVASLKQHHKRDHERRRPYACDLCSKDFFSISDYKYHMRLHKRELPYMCFTCGQKFSHVSHLHRHERVHTGDRPHKCSFCPKTFIQLGTLRIHLKKHDKENQNQDQDLSANQATAPTTTPTATFTEPNLTLKLMPVEEEALAEGALLQKEADEGLLSGIALTEGSGVTQGLGDDGMILAGGEEMVSVDGGIMTDGEGIVDAVDRVNDSMVSREGEGIVAGVDRDMISEGDGIVSGVDGVNEGSCIALFVRDSLC